jgi:hypothetical protein
MISPKGCAEINNETLDELEAKVDKAIIFINKKVGGMTYMMKYSVNKYLNRVVDEFIPDPFNNNDIELGRYLEIVTRVKDCLVEREKQRIEREKKK